MLATCFITFMSIPTFIFKFKFKQNLRKDLHPLKIYTYMVAMHIYLRIATMMKFYRCVRSVQLIFLQSLALHRLWCNDIIGH